MPREEEHVRPSGPAPRGRVLACIVLVLLPLLLLLVLLGSSPVRG